MAIQLVICPKCRHIPYYKDRGCQCCFNHVHLWSSTINCCRCEKIYKAKKSFYSFKKLPDNIDLLSLKGDTSE